MSLWGIGNSLPNFHFFQYIKAWPSTVKFKYQLVSLHNLSPHNAQLSQLYLFSFSTHLIDESRTQSILDEVWNEIDNPCVSKLKKFYIYLPNLWEALLFLEAGPLPGTELGWSRFLTFLQHLAPSPIFLQHSRVMLLRSMANVKPQPPDALIVLSYSLDWGTPSLN